MATTHVAALLMLVAALAAMVLPGLAAVLLQVHWRSNRH
jgi:hypothetical protein